MSKEDLRLRYVMANKELVSVEALRETALRAFSSSFCADENIAAAEIVISAVSRALLDLAEIKHKELCDDLEDTEQQPDSPIWFSGAAAEDFYYGATVRLYQESGFDRKYAEEAASWPDVLNHATRYPADLLLAFAKLEVGHDLLVGDYIRAAAANNYFKTEPLTAGETKPDGSA